MPQRVAAIHRRGCHYTPCGIQSFGRHLQRLDFHFAQQPHRVGCVPTLLALSVMMDIDRESTPIFTTLPR